MPNMQKYYIPAAYHSQVLHWLILELLQLLPENMFSGLMASILPVHSSCIDLLLFFVFNHSLDPFVLVWLHYHLLRFFFLF